MKKNTIVFLVFVTTAIIFSVVIREQAQKEIDNVSEQIREQAREESDSLIEKLNKANEELGKAKKIPQENYDKPLINLSVKWEKEPIKIDEIKKNYQVGIITSEPFKNDKLLIVGGEEGDEYFRMIEDQAGNVLLTNLSLFIYRDEAERYMDSYLRSFNVTLKTDKYDIEDLNSPNQIKVFYNGKTVQLIKDESTDAVFFKTREDVPKYKNEKYGFVQENIENNLFEIKLPDHTMQYYNVKLPFDIANDNASETLFSEESGGLPGSASWFDLKTNNGTDFSGLYLESMEEPPSHCDPYGYKVERNLKADDLKQGGTLQNGDAFFVFKEADVGDDFGNKGGEYGTVEQRMMYEVLEEFGKSYEKFDEEIKSRIEKTHPIFFWKDPLDRWIRFTRVKYFQFFEGGCEG